MSVQSVLAGNSQPVQWRTGILLVLVRSLLHGRFWSGVLSRCKVSSVKASLLQRIGYCCQKAEKTCSWEPGWKLFLGRLTQEMLRHGRGAVFEIQNTGRMEHELTAHSPPRERGQPAQHVFMSSVLSVCQFLCPDFPSSMETPDTRHSGWGHSPAISSYTCNDPISK